MTSPAAYSYRAVALACGIDASTLRCWVASYRSHGQTGLTKKYGYYSAAFKLDVLQRARSESLSDRQAAALFNICSIGNIGIWRRQYTEGGLDALESKRRGRPNIMKKQLSIQPAPPQDQDCRTLEDALKENEYLRAEVAYLKKLKALIDAERTEALVKKRKLFKG